MSVNALQDRLIALDGQGYKAYKGIKGRFEFSDFTLFIDYVQGDPFAAPSQLRLWVSPGVGQFPEHLYSNFSRQTALEDFLTRQFHRCSSHYSTHRGSGKSGLIGIVAPSQAILPRTAVTVSERGLEVRFWVGLPAFGRRIAGHQAVELLCEALPRLVQSALMYPHLNGNDLGLHCQVAEDADWLRRSLRDRHLIAFIADGSVLPRHSGVDDRPLRSGAVPFRSPATLRTRITLPSGRSLTGMGIPPGITLIVGGGYHGKSTLLRAIEAGIYTHIPGDGREYVVTDAAAMKIRSEDGRSVVGVNIAPFIDQLPQGRSTNPFSTADASGSTSQAANVMEAIEAGARVLLIDEDTSATNFMIRDQRMQVLIAKNREPITPFVDKVRQLYEEHGISTVLVMGGSGDYFDVADTVIALDEYCPHDLTEQAKAVAMTYPTGRQPEGGKHFGYVRARMVLPRSIDPSRGRREICLKVSDTNALSMGTEDIDLSAVEQLVEAGQVRAIAAAIIYAKQHYFDGRRSLSEVLRRVMADVQTQGLDGLSDRPTGDLVSFRPQELAAAINRLRTLKLGTP